MVWSVVTLWVSVPCCLAAAPTPDELLEKVMQSLRAQEHSAALKGLLDYVAEGKRQERGHEFRLVAKEILKADLGCVMASCRLSAKCTECEGEGGQECRKCRGDGKVDKRRKRTIRQLLYARMTITTAKWKEPRRCKSCEGSGWRCCPSCNATGVSLMPFKSDDKKKYAILDTERPYLAKAFAQQADAALSHVTLGSSVAGEHAVGSRYGTAMSAINPSMVDKDDMRWLLVGRSLLDQAIGMTRDAEEKMALQTKARDLAAQCARVASALDDRFTKEGEENRRIALEKKGLELEQAADAQRRKALR